MIRENLSKEGYAKVAKLMNAHPELAVFRRFDALHLEMLLHQQAELTHLETTIRSLQEVETTTGANIDHHQDWWSLSHATDDNIRRQWDLRQELQRKLERYYDNLRIASSLRELDRPSNTNLRFLRQWLEHPKMGGFPLFGIDGDSWGEQHGQDLWSLRTRRPQDTVSKWLAESFLPSFHRICGRRFKSPLPTDHGKGIFEYSDKAIRQITRFLSTLLASLIPLLSVSILYSVKSNVLRLGIITLLSSLFSMALTFTTNARGIEVFAATSAFAAINGAYLSNSAGSGSSGS